MGPAPPPCAQRDTFLQSRALRNRKHAIARAAVDKLAEGKAAMSAKFDSATKKYNAIVDDPNYKTMEVEDPRWVRYNDSRKEAESAAKGLGPLLLAAESTHRAYLLAEEAMEAAYNKTADCPAAKSGTADLATAMLDPNSQEALLEQLTAEPFWSCSKQRTINSADQQLLGDLGTKSEAKDCSNWGFNSLSSCQVRCARMEACGWALYDDTVSDGFCGQRGYCGMAKLEAANEAREQWTGTSCVKQTGA